jgi:hypothetical protein
MVEEPGADTCTLSEFEALQEEKSTRFATATALGASVTVAGVLADGSAGSPSGAPLRTSRTAGKPVTVHDRVDLLAKLKVANWVPDAPDPRSTVIVSSALVHAAEDGAVPEGTVDELSPDGVGEESALEGGPELELLPDGAPAAAPGLLSDPSELLVQPASSMAPRAAEAISPATVSRLGMWSPSAIPKYSCY